MQGCTLGDFFPNDKGVQSAKLFVDTAKGLQYLHAFKPPILHRDLKSSNVLVDLDREPPLAKISDFGLSIILHQAGHRRAGTRKYMAPEVIRQDAYGTPADIFSFGVLVDEGLTHMTSESMSMEDRAVLQVLRNLAAICRVGEAAERPNISDVLGFLGIEPQLRTPATSLSADPHLASSSGDSSVSSFDRLCAEQLELALNHERQGRL